ncbi:PilZ domain-containing protein [Sphingomonas sp. 7/4-4]|uniref:PilZ domain-containing protein n=1 Tax=Sphingomonas sp. 7/4-4 TaxID=3018446 RepID=UPI0022F3F2D0|nr:PilZ domain-containing protein [Sphingomonas sp. 7/4-4]WBY06775.1 PilZ domain-containing protein [Sphingomonas sp. 7/4-4]
MNPIDHETNGARIGSIAQPDRRANPRTSTALTATIRASGEARRIKGEVADVSVEGCKVFTWGLHEGDEVWVESRIWRRFRRRWSGRAKAWSGSGSRARSTNRR